MMTKFHGFAPLTPLHSTSWRGPWVQRRTCWKKLKSIKKIGNSLHILVLS